MVLPYYPTVFKRSRAVYYSSGRSQLIGFSKPRYFQRLGHFAPLSFPADALKSKPPAVRVVVDSALGSALRAAVFSKLGDHQPGFGIKLQR
jgi:hypothetical protein